MYDSRTRLVGDGLPDSTRVYRVWFVTAMLKAGVPHSKVDLFRDLLAQYGYSLTSSTNLRQLITFIHQEELSRIKQEILNQPLSIIFDGTTHVCEAYVVVLRYLTDDWELKQCVGLLKLLAKTMTGEEIAQQIIVILSTEFGISSNLIVAAMRDRASVNDVAMRTIKVVNSSNEESGTDRDDTKESMDQSTSESLQSGCPTVISLLDRPRSPTPADLSRKRHLRQNPPPKGVKTGKGKKKGDPIRISAGERVKSYPNEVYCKKKVSYLVVPVRKCWP